MLSFSSIDVINQTHFEFSNRIANLPGFDSNYQLINMYLLIDRTIHNYIQLAHRIF